MKFIILTDILGSACRFNADHIVQYWERSDGGSFVQTTVAVECCEKVRETTAQIDTLLGVEFPAASPAPAEPAPGAPLLPAFGGEA